MSLYVNENTPLADENGETIYFELKEYNVPSAKIVLKSKLNTDVMDFNHYVYYDKLNKQEIGSSISLTEAGLKRREIYLSIFTDETLTDTRKRLLYYNKDTGEVTI